MTTIETLRVARERVAQGWTQGWFARTADGVLCGARDPAAVCWCIRGAICSTSDDSLDRAVEALRDTLGWDNIAAWNDADGRTQAEVLALFDATLATLEAAS